MHYLLLTYPLYQIYLFLSVLLMGFKHMQTHMQSDLIPGEEILAIGIIPRSFLMQGIIKERGSLRTDPRTLVDF